MKKSRYVLAACFLALSGICHAHASDWYNWRGPWRTGVSPEKDLPSSWSPDPKAKDNNLVWKAPYGCRSTPLVMKGRVFLINYTGVHKKDPSGKELPELEAATIQERVMCLDADTGKFIWEFKFNVFHTDIVTSRLGWNNLAGDPETGNIYAHGTQGFLLCFDRDGKVLWSRSLTEEYGRVSGYGGRLNSPVVAEDLVIISMLNSSWGDYARGGNRFLAMNKMTGEVVWWSEPTDTQKGTYNSVPVVATINGQALLISGTSNGSLCAMKLRTGEKVWCYTFGDTYINTSAVVDGNLVYLGHGEENPDNSEKGRIICVDASEVKDGKPKLVWKKDGIKVRYASPIVHDGRLYIADEVGKLHCFDAKDGTPKWRKAYHYCRGSQGSPVLADGKIYISETASKFYILQPGDKDCKTLHEQSFEGGEEVIGSPAVANGRVYITTSDEIFCIGKPGAKPAPEPPLFAGPTKASDKIAHLQVLPADIALYPGDKVTFRVKAFDENGNFIKNLDPKECQWALPTPPPGKKDKVPPAALSGQVADGVLVVDMAKTNQQGFVTASLGNVSGRVRVRVVPSLPYVEDFEKVPDGAVPGAWVNTQGKFVVTTLKDGNKVLAKINNNPNPLLARGNAFMGLPKLKDYTMECDVFGTTAPGGESPEMGICVNRYTLLVAGGIQKLRIVSWDVLPRIDKTIDFAWKAEVWYRLKLTVDVKGGIAVVKGKAWQRDQPEPADWTLSVEDTRPNEVGSPSLYGFVLGATESTPGTGIFYDNLRITPNKK